MQHFKTHLISASKTSDPDSWLTIQLCVEFEGRVGAIDVSALVVAGVFKNCAIPEYDFSRVREQCF